VRFEQQTLFVRRKIMQLASRSPVLRSDFPLSDDQIHRVAPSIFAEAPHESRSQHYAYKWHAFCALAGQNDAGKANRQAIRRRQSHTDGEKP
jgi:hypothetical protein